MRIIEQYFGPIRDRELIFKGLRMIDERECYIKVEVNGRHLHVKQFTHCSIPAKYVMRDCVKQIMREVEQEVFGA